MRRVIRDRLHRYAEYIELVISLVIAVVITISVCSMIYRVATNPLEIQDEEAFYYFLESALSLIVGIEFLKMIIIPTSQNVIETLLFAVARQVIIDHSTIVLVSGILAVLVLFIIKKFLVSEFKEEHAAVFLGRKRVTQVNDIMNINLPVINDAPTIADLFCFLAKEKGITVQPYSKITYNDVILTVTRFSKNTIRSIEVIKTIEETHQV